MRLFVMNRGEPRGDRNFARYGLRLLLDHGGIHENHSPTDQNPPYQLRWI